MKRSLILGLLHLPVGGLIGGSYANYIKKTKQKTLLKRAADILVSIYVVQSSCLNIDDITIFSTLSS